MAPAAVVLDPLVGEAARELTRLVKRAQVDPKLPFVPARGRRHSFLVCLVLAMLGGALGLALRPWRRRVHPLLGVGIPPGDPRRRLEAIAARQLARDALGLPRRVLTPGVQEHPGAVPGDDHPIAEALSRLVIEVEGSQPVARRQAMALVLQMHLGAPFIAHLAASLALRATGGESRRRSEGTRARSPRPLAPPKRSPSAAACLPSIAGPCRRRPRAPARGRADTPRAWTATARGHRNGRSGATDGERRNSHDVNRTSSSPSFLELLEESVDVIAHALEGCGPLAEQLVPGLGELVPPLRGTGRLRVPLRTDQATCLQRTQGSIQVPQIDPPARDELGKRFGQLVPVGRPVTEQEEQRGFDEPLDPGVNAAAVTMRVPGPTPVHAAHSYVRDTYSCA